MSSSYFCLFEIIKHKKPSPCKEGNGLNSSDIIDELD